MTFRLSELAVTKPEAFSALCGRLRALGVMKLGPLLLGVLPVERDEPDPEYEAAKRAGKETPEEFRHRVMFAASSSRPPLPKPDPATMPAPVVPRRKGAGTARGGSR